MSYVSGYLAEVNPPKAVIPADLQRVLAQIAEMQAYLRANVWKKEGSNDSSRISDK
jgi:hypothetical protein